MFGELRVPVGKNEALVVPAEALAKIDNTDYVFVKKNDETFEKTPVTTGVTQNEYTEIRSGLKEGDIVVVKGSSYLKAELLKASSGEEE
jgi:multidrug efflux pump subunit AcrA (membrane-fusion protein)